VLVYCARSSRARVCKTRLVYGFNLNFNRLSEFLGELLENGLIEVVGEGRYSTTCKGGEFLSRLESLREFL
jgi:predicted transcriptional regulator